MRRFPHEFDRDRRTRVWRPRDAKATTKYSDGDATERRLAEILAGANDLSCHSPELAAAIDDWPTRYYLSPERSAALRMLELPRDARVLELGAGCGAITRYLGERCARVVAVEGSARRAEIAASRCRDLEHVEVVCGRYDDLEFEDDFDVVLMIGVLEYAGLYSDADRAHLRALERARAALDDRGVLLLAIENQLGLKYLAGCAEDHGAERHVGLEGYVDGNGVRTFSRSVLGELLTQAGLERQEWLLPFPDYKLPSVLLRASAADPESVDRYNLLDWCRQPFEQYVGEREHLFCDHLVLGELARDGRLADSANSFLVLAYQGTDPVLAPPEWIARRCNVLRAEGYRTTITLRDGTIERSVEGACDDDELTHELTPVEPVHEHCRSLSWRMLQAVRRTRDAELAFELCWRGWLEFLEQSGGKVGPNHVEPGWLDATPANLLVDPDGGVRLIDQEWRWHEAVALDWLLYRSVQSLWHAHGVWIARLPGCGSAEALFRWCAERLGVTHRALPELKALERRLQAKVHGKQETASAAPAFVPRAEPDAVADAIHGRLGVRRARVDDPQLAAALRARGVDEGSDLLWLDAPDDLRSCGDSRLIAIAGDDGSQRELLEASGFVRDHDAIEARLGREVALWRRADRLRVSIVLPTSELHGGTIVILEHARRLAERGHHVFLASLDARPPEWFELPDSVVFAPVESLECLGDVLPDADAVIATLWTTAPAVAALPASRGRGFYLVQAYESAWAGEPDDVDATYRLPLEKLCVSSWLAEELERRFSVPARVVLNGCDLAGTLDEARPPRNAPLRIGMLYHESPVKGFADGLAAFERVRATSDVQLVLYGTQRPQQLGVDFEFRQRPSREELTRLLDSLDLFVFPSRLEGFGLPPLEAMARGVAVAMTDCGGCSDYARDGAVLLSPPGDPAALAANIGRLVDDAELRSRVAARGLAVAEEFGWDRSSSALCDALAPVDREEPSLHVLYVEAGPVWFDTFLDPWMQRAFRSLGHGVTTFTPRPPDDRYTEQFVKADYLDRERRHAFLRGEGQHPDALVAAVERERPDLVFFNHGLLIPPAVLARLGEIGVPTVAWMIDEPQELDYSSDRGRLFDHVLLQDRGSLQRHRSRGNPSTHWLPHGADPDEHRPWWELAVADERRSDVLMIGTGFPARRALIESIASLDCHVRVIGRMWEGLAAPNVEVLNRPVPPDEAAEFYRGARVTLNLHRGRTDMAGSRNVPPPLDPNGSFFHISACGSLQAVNRDYPGAAWLLTPGAHYLPFDSTQELVAGIEGVLADEPARERAVRAASDRVLRHHCYAHQLRRALRDLAPIRPRRRTHTVSRSARVAPQPFDGSATIPAIDVVLTASGPPEALQHALLGVATGQDEPHEVVVVHSGDDAIADWLARRGIRQIAIDDAEAPARAFNAGYRASEGDYLLFVGAGLLLTPRLLRRLRAVLDEDASRALVGPALHPEGGEQEAGVRYRSLAEMGEVARRLYLERSLHFEESASLDPGCFMVRRAAIESVGLLDERLPAGSLELEDLCRRLRARGWRTGWSASTLAHRLAPPRRADARELERARTLLAVEAPTPTR